MPFYHETLTVPANTPEAKPAKVTLPVHRGILKFMQVRFWAGPQGLVHVRVFHAAKQIWPDRPGSYVSGEEEPVGGLEHLEILTDPLELTLRGWSPGTTYAHEVLWRFLILPKSEAMPEELILGILERTLGRT